MSISSAFSNATSGLAASARMAEVVSSNVSNALTDGYGRRQVDLSSAHLGGKGAGVQIDGITRLSDRGLLADRRIADADVARSEVGANALQILSRDFGDVGDSAGLGGRLAAFEQSLISAASDPASELRLGEVVNRLEDLTGTLRSNAKSVQAERESADLAIANDVETLNSSLELVRKLNVDIQVNSGSGRDSSALVDARQIAIDKIAAIVPIRELDRPNGQVSLMTTSGAVLLDGSAATLSFDRSPVITSEMSFESGGLSGISINGESVDLSNGFGRLAGGSLSAAFDLRDNTLVEVQSGLDDIARDLITRFEDPSVDPTLSTGSAGLLTDNGSPFDDTELVGLSERLTINVAVDPSNGGLLSRLRDGMEASASGPVGNSVQLNAWANALSSQVSTVGTSVAQTSAGKIADFGAQLDVMRVTAEESLGFENARWETFKSAELATGVDTDQELQQLLRVEQSFAANARVMQTIDTLMKRLLEI
jgi:flagellar hook-associated protein 1 FlgK